MPLIVDPYKLLQTIGQNPKAFAAIKADAWKNGQALFTKQIKHKSTDVEVLRSIYDALGDENFRIMIDGASKLKAAAKNLDKHHPEIKTMTDGEYRVLFVSLASRVIDVTQKPPKPAKEKVKKTKSAKSTFMKNKAFTVRDRENE